MSKPPKQPGAGLRNAGNTCWANATLQCLTYTNPLQDRVASDDSKRWTPLGQAVCSHLRTASAARLGDVIEPRQVLRELSVVTKTLKIGRQVLEVSSSLLGKQDEFTSRKKHRRTLTSSYDWSSRNLMAARVAALLNRRLHHLHRLLTLRQPSSLPHRMLTLCCYMDVADGAWRDFPD